GKHALDFHIAFYLGEYLTRSPGTSCVVLSKDKGFDPLIRHLVRRGFTVRRANSMAEALGSRAPPDAAAPRGQRPPATRGDNAALLAEARQLLEGTQKIRRPRKRKGLVAVLHSHFSFFFQAEDGIRDRTVTGVQTCALPISHLLCRRYSRQASCRSPSPAPERSECPASVSESVRARDADTSPAPIPDAAAYTDGRDRKSVV